MSTYTAKPKFQGKVVTVVEPEKDGKTSRRQSKKSRGSTGRGGGPAPLAKKELVTAIKENSLKIIREIIEASPEQKRAIIDTETGQTIFHHAIRSASSLETLKLLISLGASTLDLDKKGKNAIHHLARFKEAKQEYIDCIFSIEGLNVTTKDISGASPLHLAVRFGNKLLIQHLLNHPRIEIDSEDINGLTPLHYACHEGQASTVEILLKKSADPFARDKRGNTPLHYACDTGSLAIGRQLIALGVDITARNNQGDEPLHRCVTKKQETMANWLVSSGADVVVRYEKGLYQERHKQTTRKYLRQAAREARSAEPHLVEDASDEERVSDSDGADLPDDPEGTITLQDRLDAYGFLIGSEKSNQLHAAQMEPGWSSSGNQEDLAAAPSYETLHERENKQKKLIKKWIKMTKLWTEKGSTAVFKKWTHEKIRKMIYKGIPDHVRAGVWRCISGTLEAKQSNPGHYESLLTHKISKKDSHQLDVDINRTNRTHFLFKERYGQGQISLFQILQAYIIHDANVGYCQGMSDLTALMMMYIEEEESFWLLVRFMQDPAFKMAGRFATGFKDLKRAWYVHTKLVNDMLPKLGAHIRDCEIDAIHYTIKWYLKCFLDALSFDRVLRVWDVLLFEGSDILYTLAIYLLKYHEPELLRLKQDDLLLRLPALKGPPPGITTDHWLKDVRAHPIKSKIIRAYEAEFDAEYPAMEAAAKAEADRKQAEWQTRKKKMEEVAAQRAADESSTSPTLSRVKYEANDHLVSFTDNTVPRRPNGFANGLDHPEIELSNTPPKKDRKSERRKSRKSQEPAA